MPAYLDHAASTPVRPEVVEAMRAQLSDTCGNPSGAHSMARDARKAIDEVRDVVAEALGGQPGEVVFTSGGTEADNLAVLGVADRDGGVVVCGATEHHAVLDPVRSCGGVLAPVDDRGVIDLDALAVLLDGVALAGDRVSLVSVMLVNNEVGTIQPIDDVARVVRAHAPGAHLHTDAVQAVQWLETAERTAAADMVSISAHKFGGPKGVGALLLRHGMTVAPRAIGGGQERELRGGTQNVTGIVGLGVALRCTLDTRRETVQRVGGLKARLIEGLRLGIPEMVETGSRPDDQRCGSACAVPGICHVLVPGIEAEALLYLLDQQGVCASAASSCASGAMDPSHVLSAMGIPRALAFSSLRLSLGYASTDDDIDRAISVIPAAVRQLIGAAGVASARDDRGAGVAH